MRRHLPAPEIFLVLVPLLPAAVRADREEWRLSVGGSATSASMEDSAGHSTAFLAGGVASLSFGLTNAIELGVAAAVHYAPAVPFAGAVVDGDEGTLVTSLLTNVVALEARWLGGVELSRVLWRTHPIVGVRLGVLGIWSSGRVVLDQERRLVDRYDDTFTVTPVLGAEVGVQHRLGTRFVLGGVATVEAGPGYRALGVRLEASWHFY